MIPTLRAEFKKILTIRSTYIIFLLCIAITFLFAFYGEGYKADPRSLLAPNKIASEVSSAIQALAAIGGLVGLLLVTHEYRYNTIVYTLSASKSRTRVFMSKFIVMTVFALLFSAFMGALAPLLTLAGIHLNGGVLSHQEFNVWDLLWKALFAGWGYMALAFILAATIRSQVGAIATVLLFPGPIVALLGLIFKKNQIYLPFNSLNAIFGQGDVRISTLTAVLVSLAYVAVGWVIAWLLFLRRDAQ